MNIIARNLEPEIPAYTSLGNECALFETAWTRQLPLLLKGPTGCGKTRFVSHMAQKLGLPLTTVSCHDDLAAADLTGRFLLKGGDTVWVDGQVELLVWYGQPSWARFPFQYGSQTLEMADRGSIGQLLVNPAP